jgi:hypothetical protein
LWLSLVNTALAFILWNNASKSLKAYEPTCAPRDYRNGNGFLWGFNSATEIQIDQLNFFGNYCTFFVILLPDYLNNYGSRPISNIKLNKSYLLPGP